MRAVSAVFLSLAGTPCQYLYGRGLHFYHHCFQWSQIRMHGCISSEHRGSCCCGMSERMNACTQDLGPRHDVRSSGAK